MLQGFQGFYFSMRLFLKFSISLLFFNFRRFTYEFRVSICSRLAARVGGVKETLFFYVYFCSFDTEFYISIDYLHYFFIFSPFIFLLPIIRIISSFLFLVHSPSSSFIIIICYFPLLFLFYLLHSLVFFLSLGIIFIPFFLLCFSYVKCIFFCHFYYFLSIFSLLC